MQEIVPSLPINSVYVKLLHSSNPEGILINVRFKHLVQA